MSTIQNMKRAICDANHVPQQRKEMSLIECEGSHTTILACRYGERSRWWQCLVSHHYLGSVVVINLSHLPLLLRLVNLEISNLYCCHC